MCKECDTYLSKDFDGGYNFSLNFNSIRGLHKELWVSKVTKIPISEILGLPSWESWEKRHLILAPVPNHKEYYKGGNGDFPQVWAMVNLVSSCMPMVHPCSKSVPTMH